MTALTGGVTSLIGGILAKRAAKKAEEAQRIATEQAKGEVLAAGEGAATGVTNAAGAGSQSIRESLGVFDPYIQSGGTAAGQATALTSAPVEKFAFDPSSVGMDPGYLLRQKEANKAMLQNGAAFGNLQSGGFAKAFQDRNQQSASDELDRVYGRQRDTFSVNQDAGNSRVQQLLSIMGLGKSAGDSVVGGTESAAGMDLTGANLAGGFRTDSVNKGADLTLRTGDVAAVGQSNRNAANQGMLGAVNNIDWGSLFKRKPAMGNV